MTKDFLELHFMNHSTIVLSDPLKTHTFNSIDLLQGPLIDRYKEKYSHLDLPENFTLEEYEELEKYIKENEYKSIVI